MNNTLFTHAIGLRLALLLLISLPPLLAGLGASDCQFHMEVRAIASSLETRQRMQEDHDAWRVPSWNNAPRVNKPPLAVWANLLAWRNLPTDAPVDALVLRARRLGIALALVTLLATAWAGVTMGGIRFGWAAAAVTGSSLFFLRQARLATYDTYLLTFCTLAVAAGLWALQPGRTPPSPRRVWGWALAGLAMGAAFMSKGPLALLMGGGPLALMACLASERRRALWAVAGSLLLAVLVAAPWYLYVLRHVPDATRLLLAEFEAERALAQPPWYYAGLFALVFPWTLWLLRWAPRAFIRRAADQHVLRLAGAWFLFIIIVMSLPDAKQQRYLLPILPAAGLLATAMLMASQPGHPADRRWANVHAIALAIGSVLLGGFIALQPLLIARGWLAESELARLAPGWGPLLTAGLLALSIAFLRQWRAGRNECAVWITAAWMALAATPGLYGYAHSHHGRYAHRAAIEQVAQLTLGQPFFYLDAPVTEPQYIHPDPRFRLYAQRVPPGLTPNEVRDLKAPAWLTAPVHGDVNQGLLRAGWRAVLDYRDKGPIRRLYHLDDSSSR